MTSEPPPSDPVEPPPASSAAGLRRNRDFQVVLAGQAISALGDAVSLTAMPLLVLFLTGSGALMGVVAALQLLPDLVLGLPAGAIADRWDRRRMMQLADAGRAGLTFLIPLSFWLGLPTMAVVLAVAVPTNALRVLSDAALTASVPGLVGRDNLGRGYGIVEAVLSIPFIIGPALAGLLVATVGPATTIAIDAASFALSAASLAFVRRHLRAERAGEMPNLLADIRAGVGFVWRHTVIRAVIAYWAVIQVATAPLIPALGYYLTIDRRFGPELFGFVGSAWSVGYLAGSLVVARLGPRRAGWRMVGAGLGLGAAIATIAIADLPAIHLAAAGFLGAALAILLVSYASVRASLTPDALLGRVGSTARTITLGLQPIGLLVGGFLIDSTNGAQTLLVMGLVAVAASGLFGLSRTFRDAGARVGADPGLSGPQEAS